MVISRVNKACAPNFGDVSNQEGLATNTGLLHSRIFITCGRVVSAHVVSDKNWLGVGRRRPPPPALGRWPMLLSQPALSSSVEYLCTWLSSVLPLYRALSVVRSLLSRLRRHSTEGEGCSFSAVPTKPSPAEAVKAGKAASGRAPTHE